MPLVTFHGHACITVQGSDGEIIVDPYLRKNKFADVGPEEINVDAVLVTHGHGDHLGDTLEISRRCGAMIVAPSELCHFCEHQGIVNTHPMHIGGAHKFDFGWVKLTPALHGSAFIEDGKINYTGNPCGFLLCVDGSLLYHAGDTGLFGDMKLIGDMYDIDVAFLPIGDNYGMGPGDAVIAAGLLRPRIVVPIHFNTFEEIEQDALEFKRELEDCTNSICCILKPGEHLDI